MEPDAGISVSTKLGMMMMEVMMMEVMMMVLMMPLMMIVVMMMMVFRGGDGEEQGWARRHKIWAEGASPASDGNARICSILQGSRFPGIQYCHPAPKPVQLTQQKTPWRHLLQLQEILQKMLSQYDHILIHIHIKGQFNNCLRSTWTTRIKFWKQGYEKYAKP